jgi:hypothetical protein
MILYTITTKDETKQDARLQLNQDRGNGQVTARTVRAGASFILQSSLILVNAQVEVGPSD